MAETLHIDNTGVAQVQQTALDSSATADDTVLSVDNGSNISSNTYALIGGFGNELSEIVGISSAADTQLNLSTTIKYDHAVYTPVAIIQANKYRIHRAADVDGTAPTTGYSLIVEIDITADSLQTKYVDADGGAGYWYKVTQYNELEDTETSLADAVAIRGGGVGDYATLEDIREEAGFEAAQGVPDATISRYRRRAQAAINSKLAKFYVTPFSTVPDDIREITVLMAAGWLLLKNYGELEEGTNKEGRAKLKEGKEWLQLLWDNANAGVSFLPGAELVTTAPTQQVYGWPDDTTSTADPDTGAGDSGAMFKVGEDF